MLDWRDEMVIDHGGLDDDHRQLHQLIRRFLALPGEEDQRARAVALLARLRALSLMHFEREEKVQAAIRYPFLAEHAAQHRHMLDVLNEIIAQVDAPESAFAFGYVKSKADQLLPHWFMHHLAKADLPLRLHIAKVPAVMKALAR